MMTVEGNRDNIASTTAATTDIAVDSSCRSRSSTGSYPKIILASMNVTKRQRPRIAPALPMSNLLSSFGTTRRKNKDESLTMTDAILDDVLSNIETSATTTTAIITCDNAVPPQHRELVQSVSFSTKTEVHYIPSRHEISSKEYKAAWYSCEELECISESCLELIHSITTSNSNHFGTTVDDDDEESCCMRGLESFTPVALVAKNMNRSSSVQAVLNEQNRKKEQQQRRGCEEEEETTTSDDGDDESIRMIYHRISASSQLWAQAVALKDRREVEDMILEDEHCTDREVGTVGEGIHRKPRRRGVSRSHSSNSSNSTNGAREQPKKRSKPLPMRNRPATRSTTTCGSVDASTRQALDPEQATHRRVMALAA